jgi:hypothetical protein
MEGSAERQSTLSVLVEEFVQHKSSVLKVDRDRMDCYLQSPCLECYYFFCMIAVRKRCGRRIVLQLPGKVALSNAASSTNPRIHNLQETSGNSIPIFVSAQTCDLHVGSLQPLHEVQGK